MQTQKERGLYEVTLGGLEMCDVDLEQMLSGLRIRIDRNDWYQFERR